MQVEKDQMTNIYDIQWRIDSFSLAIHGSPCYNASNSGLALMYKPHGAGDEEDQRPVNDPLAEKAVRKAISVARGLKAAARVAGNSLLSFPSQRFGQGK